MFVCRRISKLISNISCTYHEHSLSKITPIFKTNRFTIINTLHNFMDDELVRLLTTGSMTEYFYLGNASRYCRGNLKVLV